MAIDTRQIEATLRDETSIAALAAAVDLSRSAQSDAVEELRNRAQGIVESDEARVSEYRHALAELGPLDPAPDVDRGQYFRAVEAAKDAVLALVVGHDVSKRERDVLIWPWISICGPFNAT